MKSLINWFKVLMVGVAVTLGLPTLAQATVTITLPGGSPVAHPTIQAAINSILVSPVVFSGHDSTWGGATIVCDLGHVEPGDVNLVPGSGMRGIFWASKILRDLTIIGNGATVNGRIVAAGHPDFPMEGVTIDGLIVNYNGDGAITASYHSGWTISNNQVTSTGNSTIFVYGGAGGHTITGNKVKSGWVAIQIQFQSPYCVISNNKVEAPYGFWGDAANVIIKDNIFTGGLYGVNGYSNNGQVIGNEFVGQSASAIYIGGNSLLIDSNLVTYNGTGQAILLYAGTGVAFVDNEVTGSGDTGIYHSAPGGEVLFEGNFIGGFSHGVLMHDATASFNRNVIYSNYFGVRLNKTSGVNYDLTFDHNTWFNNGVSIVHFSGDLSDRVVITNNISSETNDEWAGVKNTMDYTASNNVQDRHPASGSAAYVPDIGFSSTDPEDANFLYLSSATPDSVLFGADDGLWIGALPPVLDPLMAIRMGEGVEWRNHGEFVSFISEMATEQVEDGVITHKEKSKITSTAAKSSIGKRK